MMGAVWVVIACTMEPVVWNLPGNIAWSLKKSPQGRRGVCPSGKTAGATNDGNGLRLLESHFGNWRGIEGVDKPSVSSCPPKLEALDNKG